MLAVSPLFSSRLAASALLEDDSVEVSSAEISSVDVAVEFVVGGLSSFWHPDAIVRIVTMATESGLAQFLGQVIMPDSTILKENNE